MSALALLAKTVAPWCAVLAIAFETGCRKKPGPAAQTQPTLGQVRPAASATVSLLGPYTDDEARAFVKPAAAVVPVGETRVLRDVLTALSIDPRRLRNRNVEEDLHVIVEWWQLSDSFTIRWMSDARQQTPEWSLDRAIYGVAVGPRPDIENLEKAWPAWPLSTRR
jgi:hypothetical protein